MQRLKRSMALLGACLWPLLACEPTVEELAQKCLKGDARACRIACRKGVVNEGGCLGAARSASISKRAEYLDTACDGKLLEGCLEGIAVYEKLGMTAKHDSILSQACSLGHADSCSKLGDARLNESVEKALEAYRQGCRLGKKGRTECEQRAQAFTRDATQQLELCKKNDLEACQRALGLLATRNHDAAYTAAQQICSRRGLTAHYRRKAVKTPLHLEQSEQKYDSCGLFLVARASVANDRAPWPKARTPAPQAKAPEGVALAVDSVTLHFRGKTSDSPESLVETKRQLTRALEEGLERALPCFTLHTKEPESNGKTIHANFIVDRLGEALDIRASSALANPTLADCVVDSVLPEKFSGGVVELSQIPIVELTLRVDER